MLCLGGIMRFLFCNGISAVSGNSSYQFQSQFLTNGDYSEEELQSLFDSTADDVDTEVLDTLITKAKSGDAQAINDLKKLYAHYQTDKLTFGSLITKIENDYPNIRVPVASASTLITFTDTQAAALGFTDADALNTAINTAAKKTATQQGGDKDVLARNIRTNLKLILDLPEGNADKQLLSKIFQVLNTQNKSIFLEQLCSSTLSIDTIKQVAITSRQIQESLFTSAVTNPETPQGKAANQAINAISTTDPRALTGLEILRSKGLVPATTEILQAVIQVLYGGATDEQIYLLISVGFTETDFEKLNASIKLNVEQKQKTLEILRAERLGPNTTPERQKEIDAEITRIETELQALDKGTQQTAAALDRAGMKKAADSFMATNSTIRLALDTINEIRSAIATTANSRAQVVDNIKRTEVLQEQIDKTTAAINELGGLNKTERLSTAQVQELLNNVRSEVAKLEQLLIEGNEQANREFSQDLQRTIDTAKVALRSFETKIAALQATLKLIDATLLKMPVVSSQLIAQILARVTQSYQEQTAAIVKLLTNLHTAVVQENTEPIDTLRRPAAIAITLEKIIQAVQTESQKITTQQNIFQQISAALASLAKADLKGLPVKLNGTIDSLIIALNYVGKAKELSVEQQKYLKQLLAKIYVAYAQELSRPVILERYRQELRNNINDSLQEKGSRFGLASLIRADKEARDMRARTTAAIHSGNVQKLLEVLKDAPWLINELSTQDIKMLIMSDPNNPIITKLITRLSTTEVSELVAQNPALANNPAVKSKLQTVQTA